MINWLQQVGITVVSFTSNIRERLQQLAATIVKVFKQQNHSNFQPIDQQSSSQESQKLSQSSQLQKIVRNYRPPNDGKGPVGKSKDAGSLCKPYQLIADYNAESTDPKVSSVTKSPSGKSTLPSDPVSAKPQSKQFLTAMSMNTKNYNPPKDGKGPVGDSKDAGTSWRR